MVPVLNAPEALSGTDLNDVGQRAGRHRLDNDENGDHGPSHAAVSLRPKQRRPALSWRLRSGRTRANEQNDSGGYHFRHTIWTGIARRDLRNA
jgi:hypothetical protein